MICKIFCPHYLAWRFFRLTFSFFLNGLLLLHQQMNVNSDSIFWSLNKQAITTHKGWSWYIRANRNDVLLWLNETFFYKPSLLECMAGPRLVRKIIVIDGQLWEMPQTFLWRESSCTLKTLFSNSNVMLPKDGVINSFASQTIGQSPVLTLYLYQIWRNIFTNNDVTAIAKLFGTRVC